jgi:hypothetical protein
MDDTENHPLPAYDRDVAPSYDAHPAYTGLMLTLDPTGLSIKDLSRKDSPPLYSFSTSLLHVNTGTSLHVKRLESRESETSYLPVWAIGEHYMAPLHTRTKKLREILVARSHGLTVWAHLREIVWDFSTRVPLKKGEGMDGLKAGGSIGPTDPVYLIGVGAGPGTVRKNLLQFFQGKWVAYDPVEEGEIVALEREGGAECEGMPMLSFTKELDQDMMDFLVSAWCVTLWGEVGKRARRLSKTSRRMSESATPRRWYK